jgi:hypothetical protein
MGPKEIIEFQQVYFNSRTDKAALVGEDNRPRSTNVTASVRALWSPRYGLAFIDCHAWDDGVRDKTAILEPRIRFLRSPTENEILRTAMQVEAEWYAAVARAVGPQVAPQAKPKTA